MDQQGAAAQNIEALLPQLAEDTNLGEGRQGLVALLGCVVAQLQGGPLAPVPDHYVDVWARWVG